METTGRDFAEFWTWARDKGLMKENTAKSYAAPVRQVLSIDENWEAQDVSTLDIESLLIRFRNKRGRDFKPESLSTYEQRFRKAYELYMDYTSNPTTWKYKPPAINKAASKSNSGSQRKGAAREADPSAKKASVVATPAMSSTTSSIDYPFPLRSDFVANLRLPQDLTKSEVTRLIGFLQAIAQADSELASSAAAE